MRVVLDVYGALKDVVYRRPEMDIDFYADTYKGDK